MKLFLFGLTLLGLTGLILWLSDFPGLITLDWFSYHIEVNPILFVVSLVFVFIIFLLIYKIISFFVNIPNRFKDYRDDRRVQMGLKALTKALVSLAAGDGREAMRHAQNAKKNLPDAPLADFFAAKASQMEGNDDQARDYLHHLTNNQETSLLGIKGLIAYAQKENNTSLIIHLAQRAYRIKEDTPWVLTILFDNAVQNKNWKEAFDFVKKMAYHQLLSENEAKHKKAILFIAQSLELQKEGNLSQALDDASNAYRLMPTAFETTYAYAKLLLAQNDPKKARKLISKTWVTLPHKDLGKLFKETLLGKSDAEKIQYCEDLVSSCPHHKTSQLFLVEIYLSAKLWGKARQILDQLYMQEPSKEVCYLMAQLEEGEYHHHDQANAWLHKAKDIDAAEEWICQNCQTSTMNWQPICPYCQSFDSILWTKKISQPTLLLMEKGDTPFTIVDMNLNTPPEK